MLADIVQYLDTSSFNKWVIDNGGVFTATAVASVIGIYYVKPKLVYWYQVLRKWRKYWEYQALVGRSMTKRARDTAQAGEFYSWLLEQVKKGKMTHKEKRLRLRRYEIVFEFEPGTLYPKPSVPELKRRIRSRLSASAANITSVKPIRRLASLMNSKGQ